MKINAIKSVDDLRYEVVWNARKVLRKLKRKTITNDRSENEKLSARRTVSKQRHLNWDIQKEFTEAAYHRQTFLAQPHFSTPPSPPPSPCPPQALCTRSFSHPLDTSRPPTRLRHPLPILLVLPFCPGRCFRTRAIYLSAAFVNPDNTSTVNTNETVMA